MNEELLALCTTHSAERWTGQVVSHWSDGDVRIIESEAVWGGAGEVNGSRVPLPDLRARLVDLRRRAFTGSVVIVWIDGTVTEGRTRQKHRGGIRDITE